MYKVSIVWKDDHVEALSSESVQNGKGGDFSSRSFCANSGEKHRCTGPGLSCSRASQKGQRLSSLCAIPSLLMIFRSSSLGTRQDL